MTAKRTAHTLHGEVDYETVTCDSCGEEILAGEEHAFTIGDREGAACDYCVDAGPLSFPTPTVVEQLKEKAPSFYVFRGGELPFWAFVLGAAVIFPIVVSVTLSDDDPPMFAVGITWTVCALLLWAFALIGIGVILA